MGLTMKNSSAVVYALKHWSIAATLAMSAASSHAGTWGAENWGAMYWGDNLTSAPIAAPNVLSIRADGADLIVTVNDFEPGQDGWSGITSYSVTCGQAGTVTSLTQPIRIEGLQLDTAYECTVIAANALGQSPVTISLASTDEEVIQGLNMVLIRVAICSGDNPPESC